MGLIAPEIDRLIEERVTVIKVAFEQENHVFLLLIEIAAVLDQFNLVDGDSMAYYMKEVLHGERSDLPVEIAEEWLEAARLPFEDAFRKCALFRDEDPVAALVRFAGMQLAVSRLAPPVKRYRAIFPKKEESIKADPGEAPAAPEL